MRKIIGGIAYDTHKATLIHHWSNRYNSTDFHAVDETLYKTASGKWFLYYEGGALSKYAVPYESNGRTGSSGITPLSDDEARDWLEQHADADVYEQHFQAVEA